MTSNAVTAAPVRVGGTLCPYLAARERRSSQPPAPPNAPRAPPAQLQVPDARGEAGPRPREDDSPAAGANTVGRRSFPAS
ncbi:hypothetical protein NDU88_007029 [Pleurodeles waltl]|uniref:Uncharacterized protein n=1 Tax=Pleurodeles waltl TaxID=8319 RepID=A0AAV7U034_PLEWA|nr:hypothetical protein NDU88_007029 [Pleurodeles waltl]